MNDRRIGVLAGLKGNDRERWAGETVHLERFCNPSKMLLMARLAALLPRANAEAFGNHRRHESVKTHAFFPRAGGEPRMKGLRYSLTPLAACVRDRARRGNRVMEFALREQHGLQRILPVGDSFFRRFSIGDATRHVGELNQIPAAIFGRQRSNRERVIAQF